MMRVSVVVDTNLLEEALRISGARTKNEVVELALHELIRSHRLANAIRHVGTIPLTLNRRTLRLLRSQT